MPGSSNDQVYSGIHGRTRSELVHFSCSCGLVYPAEVIRAVNVTRDPLMGARLREGSLNRVQCPSCQAVAWAEVPVTYHDEVRRVLVLVLPVSLRHRELQERAELYLEMARDRAAVPEYAKCFHVALGGEGLSAVLASHGDPSAGHDTTAVTPAPVSNDIPGAPCATPQDDRIVSGEIVTGMDVREASVRRRRDLVQAPTSGLIALLDDKDARRDSAIELCRRKEAHAVGPVLGALRRMTRGEAVRVLPMVVHFGDRAVPHLIDGLRSKKGFLRQGCALALGVLKSADGLEPLCDLLLVEPTDVWREVARAVGEFGGRAVMTIMARIKDTHDNEAGIGRITWALAHVAARGGRVPVETLAQGREPVAAAAARKALELSAAAKDSDAEVRGPITPRDQTVNRAFSRRFFEMMGRTARSVGRGDGDTAEELVLDDALVLEDEELLEDKDLIPG
ncbi:MAG: hypothetical protein HY698_03275 [Deltaproteobacteria bacterium]|nr:hypothetical protein [Deltaproteobacteria bacterium]